MVVLSIAMSMVGGGTPGAVERAVTRTSIRLS